jgi:hypothetical protein
VWARDGARCAFVSASGHHCRETRFLEYHHVDPYAQGGEHRAENIELRCRSHNQHEADLAYSEPFMAAKRRGDDFVRERFAPYMPLIVVPSSALANMRASAVAAAAVTSMRHGVPPSRAVGAGA